MRVLFFEEFFFDVVGAGYGEADGEAGNDIECPVAYTFAVGYISDELYDTKYESKNYKD